MSKGELSFWLIVLCGLVLIATVGCSPAFTLTASGAADIATTHYALGQGKVEANPLFSGSSLQMMVLAKVAITGYLVWLCRWLDGRGHHGWSNAVQWIGTTVWGGAAVWNLHQVR